MERLVQAWTEAVAREGIAAYAHMRGPAPGTSSGYTQARDARKAVEAQLARKLGTRVYRVGDEFIVGDGQTLRAAQLANP